jgi:hypothetical protein
MFKHFVLVNARGIQTKNIDGTSVGEIDPLL